MSENDIAEIVVDSMYHVHKNLGPGLLENAYEECLHYELLNRGVNVQRQKALPVIYKTIRMEVGYRLDLLIEDKVIVEVKAVEKLNDVHMAQVITYLKLSGCKLGLLVNFNVALIKNGMMRVVNGL